MRVVFAGTPDTAVPSLRALLDSPRHDVVAVVTRPDAPKGRGRTLRRSPVGEVADAAAVPVLTPSSAKDPAFADELRALGADAAAVVAYGNILPQSVLDIPRLGWVNLHFSLLPAWRGASPVNAAIAAGDDVTGASTFRLEAGMDTGPVYGTITETITDDDTAGTLLERLAEAGAGLLAATLDGMESGELSPVPQPVDGVSYTGKISTEDARIRWDHPAFAIDRHVRSITPAPGAWTELDGARVKIGGVASPAGELPEAATGLAPGALGWTKKALYVGTATGPLEILRLQPPGKKMMNAMDWVRGSHLEQGVALS